MYLIRIFFLYRLSGISASTINLFFYISSNLPIFITMEKFSAWRDKGTGISPFMPLDIAKSPVKKYVVDPILLLVKLPVFFILYIVAAVAPKPAIKAVFSLLFGFSDIDVLVEGIRRTRTAEIDRNRPGINQVVISNWISPLDVFLVYILSNVASLKQVAVVLPSNGALYTVSAWLTISLFFGEEVVNVGEKIVDFSSLKDKLVLYFVEGTASNNRAVLPFASTSTSYFDSPGFTYKALVLKMYPNSLTLPIPYLSRWQYLTRLLTHLSKGLFKVKIVPMETISANSLRLVYADNGLSTVELGSDQKEKFREYYKSYALSNFTK